MIDPEQMADDGDALPVLTRDAVRAQVQARRDGALTDAALAAWAFKQFYDEDMDSLALEEDAEEEIRDVLDMLMFIDEPAFALDDAALDALLQQLQP